MDVNGLPFRLVAGGADFGFGAAATGARVAQRLALSGTGQVRLASEQTAPDPALEDEIFARGMIAQPSPVADPLGGFAWWNAGAGALEASGFAPGSMAIPLAASGGPVATPADMMLGDDDILYVARSGAVTWHDLRARWPDVEVRHATFTADLLAPAPGGGGWAFDRINRRLLRLRGRPVRFAGLRAANDAAFAPVEPNRNAPRLTAVARGGIAATLDAVALATSPGGQLALLAWESGGDAAILLYTATGFVEFGRLTGLRFPYALAWNGQDELAVIASQGQAAARQAYVYAVSGAAVAGRPLNPEGRIHPLLRPWNGGFCNALSPQPRHLAVAAGAAPGAPPIAVRPLHALSGGDYARAGQVLIGPIDGGVAGCIWHRFYAEAALANNSAIDLQLFANDIAEDPALPADANDPGWALHRILPHRREDTPAGTAVAAWLPARSEIPLAPAMLACAAQPDKAGLFTALIQQPGRVVRRIAGRYLWVVLTLSGDSQCTPELAALRFYARRLSWRDRYLPAFYSETLSGSDAQAAGPATRHDFMERLLHGHEGALTEIEGRIAESWQLTDPGTAPDAALAWLGAWIGLSATRGEATARQRQRLRAAPYTAPLAGTLGGLLAALELTTGGQMVTGGRLDPGRRIPGPGELAVAQDGDIAVRGLMLALGNDGECTFLTGGAVTKGDIVAVEGFRLRRTFATILGADLDEAEDPLTLGLSATGNSFVGDTLILGDEARDELLALYAPEIASARGDAAAVAGFYARLAWRVLVLVRGVDDATEFQRLADVVAAEIPAHVEPQVLRAHNPLIVGTASLLGIDTYLGAARPVRPVRLGESWVGAGDVIAGAGGLDARADGPAQMWAGSAFTLRALASRAGVGGQINRYIWMWEREA